MLYRREPINITLLAEWNHTNLVSATCSPILFPLKDSNTCRSLQRVEQVLLNAIRDLLHASVPILFQQSWVRTR